MSEGSAGRHRQTAAQSGPIAVGIVTVSDTRTEDTDFNGRYLKEQVAAAGHHVVFYRLVPDEPERIRAVLDDAVDQPCRLILFNGGTGLSRRDRTFDVLAGRLTHILPGFGELFRMLSFEEVGAAAMLSRAVAGVYRDTLVFSTPGSPNAVRLAWERLIRPELNHLVWDLTR